MILRLNRGFVDSPSRLLAAVRRFRMVDNTTDSAWPQIPPGIPSDWCGRVHYDVRMAPPGEKHAVSRDGSVSY